MESNATNVSLWSCIHSMHCITWNLPCIVSRIGGVVILAISIFCLKMNIRFLYSERCQNSLVVSLFLASILVSTTSVPGVLVQLFTCHRHCFKLYCRIDGFVSYFSGCLCMLVFLTLSIHRYLSLCSYDRLSSYRCLTFGCWFLSIAFTFPLTLNYFNSYVPEGLGFHCSINWQDKSTVGRVYILSSFIAMYFFSLLMLLFVNLRANLIVRHIYSKHYSNSSVQQFSYQQDSMKNSQQSNGFEKAYLYKYCAKKASYRKYLRADYRFLRGAIFLVSSYLIAWTPYSIIAVLQLLDVKFIFQHSVLITISAFIAKISVIVAPFVYLSIMKYKSLKQKLFK
ncbi:unnamed protein product [Rotaria socialis]|uniref:G-protein coupled receptors family 1 profile domain-containing protein n=1 Tax=Rotaria socialis TaxID=392032 RepID=A0A820M7I4_9BILA|nr:unnamed protein product [Rotaria socialis]CAF4368353.1 unnamed protein product [Rotaria socialis]